MPDMGTAHGHTWGWGLLRIGAPLVGKLLSEVQAGFSQQTETLDRPPGPGGPEPQIDLRPGAARSLQRPWGWTDAWTPLVRHLTRETGRPPTLASEEGRLGCSEMGQEGSTERIHVALHLRRAQGPCGLWVQASFVPPSAPPHSSLGKKVHRFGAGLGLGGQDSQVALCPRSAVPGPSVVCFPLLSWLHRGAGLW